MHLRVFGSLIGIAALLIIPSVAEANVFRTKLSNGSAYLIIEVLDDDLVHFEVAATGNEPDGTQPIYTSPMILKADYQGSNSVVRSGNVIETREMRLEVNSDTLCITAQDKTRQNAYLTTICPQALNQPFKGLDIDPGQIQDVYGLGQQFTTLGSADGDWTALGVREGLEFGNGFQNFQEARVGNIQIPVYYGVGDNGLNYALLMDNVYKQRWDFTTNWWQARMFGDQLRFYLMTGADLPDLRADYMELTGRPPVPPRKAFGLWVSEFGYDNWNQIDTLLSGLRQQNFPIDGFVLDLNWFGGIAPQDPDRSAMGRLNWDQNQDPLVADDRYFFPDPATKIQQYAADDIQLAAIEESYLARPTDTYRNFPPNFNAYQRTNGVCDLGQQSNPIELDARDFWGVGRMIDWTDQAAANWIQNQRRLPNLIQLGINVHWTDLGEPERYDPSACYEGVEAAPTGRKIEHADIHNLYNLLWNQSIWQGYVDNRGQANRLGVTNPRPFILTRSGTAGIQRYGTALWSGDIAANLQSLATHFNAQLHMSFSGIDFYGADVGGFRREVMPDNDREGSYRGYEAELYTQWFANGSWLDVPVRPHTDNEFVRANPPYPTAPHLVGKVESNLANIRQRYELIPYYYSLAYRAHLAGEPVVAPLVLYYQNDQNVRQIGHEKLIGRDLLVGVVAQHGEYERDVYLPAGRWINYHSNEWVTSSGEAIANLPVYRDGIFRLPVFARSGAIIPQMAVDENTKDAFGQRRNGSPGRNELIVKVYADRTPSRFTLYEDDGRTLNYTNEGTVFYAYRTTELSQQQLDADTVQVAIAPAESVNGNAEVITSRSNVVRLVVDNAQATGVTLNGSALPQVTSQAAFDAAEQGWLNAGQNLILAKSPNLSVDTAKTFRFELAPTVATTSINFVCDRGFTSPGESIYITGNLPALGNWNPANAIKLDPNVYYQYIIDGRSNPGPAAPIWTKVISNLPPNTALEWKCLRRREDGSSTVTWESGENNRFTTTGSGYSGQAYGEL
jgi:alpha-glucosidase (family GH31 glycosyl hydrolase)